MKTPKDKSDAEWRAELTPEAYRVAREHGTERAFTGLYWDSKDQGTYRCICCGAELFSSETKYDSGSGWPSFYRPLNPANIGEESDTKLGMRRTEVHCNQCGADDQDHARRRDLGRLRPGLRRTDRFCCGSCYHADSVAQPGDNAKPGARQFGRLFQNPEPGRRGDRKRGAGCRATAPRSGPSLACFAVASAPGPEIGGQASGPGYHAPRKASGPPERLG